MPSKRVCACNKRIHHCSKCYPVLHLQTVLRRDLRRAVRQIFNTNSTIDYHKLVGCGQAQFQAHLLAKMDAWNTATQQRISLHMCEVDHICPFSIVQELPVNMQEQACHMLCHYTNLQPLPTPWNRRKSNNWSARDHALWMENIYMKPDFRDIYWPLACQ